MLRRTFYCKHVLLSPMCCVFVLFTLCESIINHFCSQLQLAFQFCPVASPLRGSPIRHEISIHHHLILPLPPHFSSVLSNLAQMDSSSRNSMPAPSTTRLKILGNAPLKQHQPVLGGHRSAVAWLLGKLLAIVLGPWEA